MQKRSSVDLLSDPIDSSLRRFAVPMAFSFMINMIYSLIDRFYASRLGDAAIAAIGTTDQVTFLVFTLASGFAVGSGIIVARRFGERNLEEAGRTATQAVGAMLSISMVITAGLYIAMPYIPQVMQMQPDVAPHAIDYMTYLYMGFAANLLNFQLFAIIRSTGNPYFPMIVMIFTTVMNAILAPFLIFGIGPFPEMGLGGAGLATAIAQVSGSVVALWAVLSGKTALKMIFKGFRPDFTMLARIGRLGLPASIQMLAVSVNRAVIFIMVGGYGTSVTAAYTLGLNLEMVVFMSVFALGVTVEVATGQNLGAGKADRAKAYHRSAIKQGGLLMVTLGILVWLGGRSFIEIYSSNPYTIGIATSYLQITVFGYAFFAIGVVTIRAISGAGASFISMMITGGTLLMVQLPLSYYLSHYLGWGPNGVWTGLLVGYMVFCAVALGVYRSNVWRGKLV